MAPVDDVETYCEAGVWKTRWLHSAEPFATDGGRQRQICQGATVASWYGVDHIIKNPDGTIAERNSYSYGPEPDPDPDPGGAGLVASDEGGRRWQSR